MGVSKGRNRLIKHVEIELSNKQIAIEEMHNEKVLLLDFLFKNNKKNSLPCSLNC